MSNFNPLIYTLIIFFVLGIVINLSLSDLVDLTTINPDSSVGNSGLYTFVIDLISSDFLDSIDTGISFLGFGFDIPVINLLALNSTAQDFVLEQVILLTYIPDELLLPMLILGFLALTWTSYKAISPV